MNKSLTGNEIREIRKEYGVSQCEFASILGITAPYLSDIERGIKTPSQQLINLIQSITQAKEKRSTDNDAERWKDKYIACLEELNEARKDNDNLRKQLNQLNAPSTGAAVLAASSRKKEM